jgi:hypothetical protein
MLNLNNNELDWKQQLILCYCQNCLKDKRRLFMSKSMYKVAEPLLRKYNLYEEMSKYIKIIEIKE